MDEVDEDLRVRKQAAAQCDQQYPARRRTSNRTLSSATALRQQAQRARQRLSRMT